MRIADKEQLKLLLPVLIPVLILSIVPLLRGIYLGFTDYQLGSEIQFNGIDNYLYMLKDQYFWRSFKVGFIWTITVTGAQLVLGLLLALLLNTRVRFSGVYSLLILIPWAMPPVIRGVVWKQMFDPDTGAVNVLLTGLGIIHTPINWLTSYEFAIPAVIVAGIWGELPKTAVFLFAGLQTIPKSLYEAAAIDGASERRIFWSITLPLLRPVLVFVLVTTIIGSFQIFDTIAVTTGGGPIDATRVITWYIFEFAFQRFQMGYATAVSVVLFLILIIATILQMRILRADESDLA